MNATGFEIYGTPPINRHEGNVHDRGKWDAGHAETTGRTST